MAFARAARLDGAGVAGQKTRMNQRPGIVEHLAEHLKAARKARGLSLDAVARLSGVSRSMVSQIERGESSPTVATLWNLTQALQVDFAGLLAGQAPGGIEVIRAQAAPVIDARGEGVRIRILSPPESVGRHEVYELVFAPGGMLSSAPHSPGCRELLTVIEGQLTVASGEAETRLETGDTAGYAADRRHSIAAGQGAARAILIVQGS